MATNDHQPKTILHLSKDDKDLTEFRGGLEELLKFAMVHGIEERLDGLHIAREVRYPSQQHQEDNQHEQ